MKNKIINDSSVHYARRMKVSLLISLIMLICLFSLAPSINTNPYTMKNENKTIILQAVIEPLKNLSDMKEIPKQSLPKRITETENENEVSDMDIRTDFEDSVITNTDEDDRIYTIYETPPKLLTGIEVKYPEAAKKMGIEGKVYLRIVVEKDGKVSSVEVIKSDNIILNDAAVEAVKNAIFSPAMARDLPVRCVVTLPIMFKLTKYKSENVKRQKSRGDCCKDKILFSHVTLNTSMVTTIVKGLSVYCYC
ncbi:MAG: energy transducer TonB [bacterium]